MSLKNNKALLIINPKAGVQAAKTYFYQIISILSKKYDLTVHITEYSGDARDTAAEAKDFDTIICCGGDGTVSQTLEGLKDVRRPINIGYIPAGSTNDLATAIGLPKNVQNAAKTVVNGQPFPHDIGSFNEDKRFVYTATFGIFASTSYETPQNFKNIFGHFAYILAGASELTKVKEYNISIDYDGGHESFDHVLLCSVLNTTSIGGVLKLPSDNIFFSDGLFEAMIIKKPDNFIELNDLIAALSKGDFSNKNLRIIQSSDFKIKIEGGAPWTIDGESAGKHDLVRIKCLSNAIRIIK